MVASVAFNYLSQTNFANTFNVSSTGLVQGMFIDDPAVRYQLAGGVLAQSETIPMWGGVGITENTIPNTITTPPDITLGSVITRATAISPTGGTGALTGFSTYAQNHAALIVPGGAPLTPSGGLVNLFRLGSNARIAVLAASSIASNEGFPISQQVSWDFVNQQLIPYIPAYASATSTAVSYNSTTGVLSLTFAAAPFGASYATLGSYVAVSGITGTGAVASLAGNFPIFSVGSSGTVIGLQAPTGLTVSGLGATSGVIAAGGGALPVKLLEYQAGNSMVISYNAATNFASWVYTGNAAVIQL